VSGTIVAVPGARLRSLLAVLAVHAPEVVSVDALQAALWGDEPPSTNALQKLVSKLRRAVPVNASTLNPAGPPELVTTGMMGDDFCIDENTDVAYVTTHRQNTIERVALEPHSHPARQTVAGEPFDPQLIGPASCTWLRGAGDYGSVAYITTDGGSLRRPRITSSGRRGSSEPSSVERPG
jgi:hypothetical protein